MGREGGKEGGRGESGEGREGGGREGKREGEREGGREEERVGREESGEGGRKGKMRKKEYRKKTGREDWEENNQYKIRCKSNHVIIIGKQCRLELRCSNSTPSLQPTHG